VDIEETLFKALAELRGDTLADVCAAVGDHGGIDSLEGVELVAAAEERFGITIEDDEVTSHVCRSIPRLAALVRAKLHDA